MTLTKCRLGELIQPSDERNLDNKYNLDNIKGISTGKEFIETKANMDGVSLSSYKVVRPWDFAYVADTSRRGEKIALAYNKTQHTILISSIYTVFCIARKDLLLSTICLCISTDPNLTDMHGLILGVQQGRLLIGIRCAISRLNFPTFRHSRSMWTFIMLWLPISKATNADLTT